MTHHVFSPLPPESLVQVFEEYLEDVAALSEELSLAQLPDAFQAMVLRELEQACRPARVTLLCAMRNPTFAPT